MYMRHSIATRPACFHSPIIFRATCTVKPRGCHCLGSPNIHHPPPHPPGLRLVHTPPRSTRATFAAVPSLTLVRAPKPAHSNSRPPTPGGSVRPFAALRLPPPPIPPPPRPRSPPCLPPRLSLPTTLVTSSPVYSTSQPTPTPTPVPSQTHSPSHMRAPAQAKLAPTASSTAPAPLPPPCQPLSHHSAVTEALQQLHNNNCLPRTRHSPRTHMHPHAGMRSLRYCSTAAVPLSRMGRLSVRSGLPSRLRARREGPSSPSWGGSDARLLLDRCSSSSLRRGGGRCVRVS